MGIAPPRLSVIEGGGRPRAFRQALEFASLGAGLTFIAVLLGRLPAWLHNLGAFQSLFALAFVFYGLALLRLERYAAIPHAALGVFAVALSTRIALLPAAPSLSGDIYRYVWEGRVVAHGGNPYRQSPLDPALAPLRDREIFPRLNHRELATIYPPLAVGGFALLARVAPSVGAFKLWVVLHDLALVMVLLAWAARRGQSPVTVLAYAWNPLVLVEYAGSGHNDPTALLWMALAFLWLDSRPIASAIALALGALVKLAPLVALPFLLRRWPWRARLACLALLAAGLGWFWTETRGPSSGLSAYWGAWRNNELLFHYFEGMTGSYATARSVALALLVATIAYAWWRDRAPERATRLAVRSGTLLSPVVHPWYLGWELFFEPLAPSWPWLLLSLTAILNYGVLATPAAGRDFHLPLPWRWLEYGGPLALALLLAAARAARRSAPAGT